MSELRARRSLRHLWVSVAVVLVAAGCGTQGLVLKQPDQVQHLEPVDFSTVKVPMTVSWQARPLASGERYLVFVDQFPMPPGDDIRSLADDTCKATKGCPNAAYLAQHFIFATKGHSVKVPFLPLDGPFPVNDLYNLHRATIVIIDRDNARTGEEFWTTTFFAAAQS